MDKLDTLVTENLIERLFQPERLNVILGKLANRRSDKASEIDRRVSALQAEIATAEDKLRRLYTMVENDLTDLDDILKDRIATLENAQHAART
jgi:site-specific DNA recombinase